MTARLKRLLILPLLFTIFITCESEVIPSTAKNYLLFQGIDLSKTFQHHPRLEPDDLRNFCTQLATKEANVVLLISAIGNPNSQPFLRCHLRAVPKLDRSLTLTEQRRTVLKQQKIKASNTIAIEKFITAYQANIYSQKSSQYTDLSGFLQKVNMVSDEPQYSSFDKAVFLYSDCKHDVGKNTKPISIDLVDFPAVKFHTVGVQNRQLFRQLPLQEYESPQAFFNNYLLTF